MMVRRVAKDWDLFVVHSIFTGYCFSKINTFNSNLLYAWMICLCDLVYSIDVLARTSKKTKLSKVFVNPSFAASTLSTNVPTILSCIPYHVLVVVGLDISGVYLLLCALRVARLLKSGRINVHFASLFSSRTNGLWKLSA
ncbi:hypothetical protein ACROYT_G032503 [Oculina patagonica]